MASQEHITFDILPMPMLFCPLEFFDFEFIYLHFDIPTKNSLPLCFSIWLRIVSKTLQVLDL